MENFRRKYIFLIDAVGATVSILCLYLLYSFEELFGMPQRVTSIFIGIAIALSIYSFTCYFLHVRNWRLYLVIIAVLNIIYCIFTIFQIVQNSSSITLLGFIYFIVELLIILSVATYELKLTTKQPAS
ncbi:hypothetical protein C4F40_01305 [Sphingobacterium sp. Ka21]|uniref:DUF2127 domain-containing protein n=1 Tax=Sphingobacterium pedocola TaxID=2082722 RepID=A0ABR9T207_9SPHI|nr:hypothetical protein [Sphingobacterium pedocola]